MRYEECLEYLYSQLPVFQRVGEAAYKADLSNTLALSTWALNPEKKFKSIHIAGTNGKGSVSHLVASVLQEQGYAVGLYTSPHLSDFHERIRVNGKMVEREFVVAFTERLKKDWEELQLQPSFFEITVIMAFEYFAMRNVDIAVIETGMGGRLDSTNIVDPELAVITNVGLDHTRFLGNTIEDIAKEKAGIIKPNTPVVLGAMREKAALVCRMVASRQGADVTSSLEELVNVPPTPLHGAYQLDNAKTAFLSCSVLAKNGWQLSPSAIGRGFQNVIENTGLKGRWQILSENPLTIADVAHNADGINSVINELNKMEFKSLHIVLGLSGDKDSGSILELLPNDATYYFCRANVPRAMDTHLLHEQATQYGLVGEQYKSVSEALLAAKLQASKEDVIFVGGSFFVVAEVV
jgi:dihydrofolate synthase/folylpolyglutamate synthase